MQIRAFLFTSTCALIATPAFAAETRELDAHVHGVGALNIAVEGDKIAMELEAPGFDIVGFEHRAESAEDKEKIEQALALLSDPLSLFGLPSAAGCAVTEVSAELHGGDEHGEDVDHDDHEHGHDHDHDEHAEGEAHDDHEGHDDHDDHAGDASHTEFHAAYLLTCADIAAVQKIELPYFQVFQNAEELEVQLVTETGSALLEATGEEAVLDLTQAK